MVYTLTFGKHSGKSLEWLFFNDPGYVWWMISENIFNKFPSDMQNRFDQLVRRAKHLKIPGNCPWYRKRPITHMLGVSIL